MGGGNAQAHHQVGTNNLQLLLQPGTTGFDLALPGRAVLRTPTLLDPGTVLDRVGEVQLPAGPGRPRAIASLNSLTPWARPAESPTVLVCRVPRQRSSGEHRPDRCGRRSGGRAARVGRPGNDVAKPWPRHWNTPHGHQKTPPSEEISEFCGVQKMALGRGFAVAFERKFGQPLPSLLNDGQRILLVAPGRSPHERRV